MMKATKAAIMDSENKLRKKWKTGISETVDPSKDEMADLRTTVEKLQFSTGSSNSQLDKENLNSLNSFDPALRRVAFIGFKVDVLESNQFNSDVVAQNFLQSAKDNLRCLQGKT
eukprot:7236796-Pyramimonas_sp.AAC.1